ncbi:MAG: hypothetical protein I8H77_17295 [Comamonadaceae bacterium]|nr:hypothetical protein [Comamonadaceae bacterium]
MLAGKDALAQGIAGGASKDVGILNVALGLEHEAINAQQLGTGSGLLPNRYWTWQCVSKQTTKPTATR